jgi:hypothetical protein
MNDSTSVSAKAKQLKKANQPSEDVITRILRFSQSIEVSQSKKLGTLVIIGN